MLRFRNDRGATGPIEALLLLAAGALVIYGLFSIAKNVSEKQMNNPGGGNPGTSECGKFKPRADGTCP